MGGSQVVPRKIEDYDDEHNDCAQLTSITGMIGDMIWMGRLRCW